MLDGHVRPSGATGATGGTRRAAGALRARSRLRTEHRIRTERRTGPASRIRVPTLVIASGKDRLVDVRAAIRLARTIPGARPPQLRGVGHVAQMEVPEMEVPEITARAMVALLDEYAATDVNRGVHTQLRARLIRPGESVA